VLERTSFVAAAMSVAPVARTVVLAGVAPMKVTLASMIERDLSGDGELVDRHAGHVVVLWHGQVLVLLLDRHGRLGVPFLITSPT
jgi:hypothetical protein